MMIFFPSDGFPGALKVYKARFIFELEAFRRDLIVRRKDKGHHNKDWVPIGYVTKRVPSEIGIFWEQYQRHTGPFDGKGW